MAGSLINNNPGHDLTKEDQSKGGLKSAEVRRENARLRKQLEAILDKKNKNSKDETYEESITIGLIANAIDRTKGGNPEAYKTIARILGELDTIDEPTETPAININIVDNSKLEKVLYEEE